MIQNVMSFLKSQACVFRWLWLASNSRAQILVLKAQLISGGLKCVYLSAVLHAEHCHRTVGSRVEVCLLKMETCLNCYINIVTGSLRVRVSRQMAFHWRAGIYAILSNEMSTYVAQGVFPLHPVGARCTHLRPLELTTFKNDRRECPHQKSWNNCHSAGPSVRSKLWILTFMFIPCILNNKCLFYTNTRTNNINLHYLFVHMFVCNKTFITDSNFR